MRRFGSVLLVIAGLSVALCSADTPAGSDARPDVKDADAQRIIHVMDTADAKAYADYLRVVQKIHHDAFAKLNVRKADLTRLGKLDDAVTIRDFIDFVTKQDTDNDTDVAPDGTKLFMPVSEVVGTWAEHSGAGPFFQLLPNGHFVYDNNEPGTWALTADSLTLTWNTKAGQHNIGRVDTYTRIDGEHISGNSSQGHQVGIDRVEPNSNTK
jgi:hypothetical protein